MVLPRAHQIQIFLVKRGHKPCYVSQQAMHTCPGQAHAPPTNSRWQPEHCKPSQQGGCLAQGLPAHHLIIPMLQCLLPPSAGSTLPTAQRLPCCLQPQAQSCTANTYQTSTSMQGPPRRPCMRPSSSWHQGDGMCSPASTLPQSSIDSKPKSCSALGSLPPWQQLGCWATSPPHQMSAHPPASRPTH